MTNKEEQVFKIIIDYIKENGNTPSFRYIQKSLKYKSINSITQYLKSLENKGYIKKNNHKISINNTIIYNKNIKRIKIINMNNKYIELALNYKKNYLAYKINHNYFSKISILKNDILVFQKSKKIRDNDIGLFIIDNKYRVMKYQNKDVNYVN